VKYIGLYGYTILDRSNTAIGGDS